MTTSPARPASVTQLDDKLARISGRVRSRNAQAKDDAANARSEAERRIAHDETLAYLADLAWNHTGPNGGLLWLKLDGYERGRDLPSGFIPAHYEVSSLALHQQREAERASEAKEAARPRKGTRRVATVLRKKGRK